MLPAEILTLLRSFVAHDKIAILPLALAVPEMSGYKPFETYFEELAAGSKPERVAEDLFRALAGDVARLKSIPQVKVGDGFVDFIIGGEEHGGGGIVIELKPLFTKSVSSGCCIGCR